MYACHFRENVPKGKVVSVYVSFLSPNKICDGNFLNFSLSAKGKLKGFPLARNSLLLTHSSLIPSHGLLRKCVTHVIPTFELVYDIGQILGICFADSYNSLASRKYRSVLHYRYHRRLSGLLHQFDNC